MMAAPQDLSPQRGQESHHGCLELTGGGGIYLVQGKEGPSQNKGRNPCLSREAGLPVSA